MSTGTDNAVDTARQIIQVLKDHLDDFLPLFESAHSVTLPAPANTSYQVTSLTSERIPEVMYETPAIVVGWEQNQAEAMDGRGAYMMSIPYVVIVAFTEADVDTDDQGKIQECAQDYATAIGQCVAKHLPPDAQAAGLRVHSAYMLEEQVNEPIYFADEDRAPVRTSLVRVEVKQYQSMRG